jgi:SAM-dependent methyltransferase
VVARYDGLADWYEDYISGEASAFTAEAGVALTRLLGRGPGRCLDVGCGTGVYIAQAVELGWVLTGVDNSEDQLRVARRRVGESTELLCADAARLPFASGSFDAVYAMMIHTDVPDIAKVFAEMGRVLVGGGRFVYVGTHPCFVAPFIARQPDQTTVIHPGYAEARRYDDGPGVGEGIRARVGAYHHPLSALIGALPAAGLQIDSIEELYGDPPRVLTLGACRARSAAT